jgi:hypothetical protein
MQTKIAAWNETRRGYVKGQPKDYIYGHAGALKASKQKQSQAKKGKVKKWMNSNW